MMSAWVLYAVTISGKIRRVLRKRRFKNLPRKLDLNRLISSLGLSIAAELSLYKSPHNPAQCPAFNYRVYTDITSKNLAASKSNALFTFLLTIKPLLPQCHRQFPEGTASRMYAAGSNAAAPAAGTASAPAASTAQTAAATPAAVPASAAAAAAAAPVGVMPLMMDFNALHQMMMLQQQQQQLFQQQQLQQQRAAAAAAAAVAAQAAQTAQTSQPKSESAAAPEAPAASQPATSLPPLPSSIAAAAANVNSNANAGAHREADDDDDDDDDEVRVSSKTNSTDISSSPSFRKAVDEMFLLALYRSVRFISSSPSISLTALYFSLIPFQPGSRPNGSPPSGMCCVLHVRRLFSKECV